MVCTSCNRSWFYFIGGLGRVGSRISGSVLKCTEFKPGGMIFGAAVTSDGAELRKELGVALPLDPEEGVSLQIEDVPFQMDLSMSGKSRGMKVANCDIPWVTKGEEPLFSE